MNEDLRQEINLEFNDFSYKSGPKAIPKKEKEKKE
jgi:hypothetical protein